MTASTTPTTSTAAPAAHAAAWPPPARVAAAGLGGFALASVIAGVLHPGYDPLREGISALAATDSPSAPIMIAGFLALAVGTVAAGVGLWGRLRVGVAGRIGAALVVLSGALMVVAGLARQDCSDSIGACAAAEAAGTLSGHHVLHQLVSLAVFLLLTIALFVLPRGLRRSPWRHLAVPTRLGGVVALAVVVALVTIGTGEVAGLVQRVFLAVVFGGPVLLAALPGRTA